MKNIIFFTLIILSLNSCAHKITKVEAIPEHEYVDLGLSVKWAKYNIGANKPEEVGSYFIWGKENGKNYMGSNAELYDQSIININNILTPNNDIVTELWDNDWRLPTKEDFEELKTKCTWEWSEYNGSVGQKITGPNGNSIFLPFGGIGDVQWGAIYTEQGYYWSSSVAENENAYYFHFDLSESSIKEINRLEKLTIRAVK